MKRFIISFIAVVSIGVLTAVNSQSLFSLELQHRSAPSLIPLIEPLLNKGEAVSGQNSLIIFKTSRTRYQELSALIQQLDKPAKQLLIEVKSPSTLVGHNKKYQKNIVINNQSSSQITHSSSKTISTRSNDPIHSIRVLDGHRASISDGRIIPLLSRSLRFGQNALNAPQGHVEAIELSYHEVASTIYVQPQLHGNTVTLEITPHYSDIDQESNSGIQSRTSSTTITLPLNQWSSLGGVSQQSQTYSNNSISTRAKNNETMVRVSIIPN